MQASVVAQRTVKGAQRINESTSRHSRALASSSRPDVRRVLLKASEQQQQQQSAPVERLQYDKILLTILDSNPYLSDGSRQAISTCADLAKIHNSKVTVLVVDQPGAEGDPTVKLQVINKSLQEAGCEGADILEKAQGSGSVLVGDVADEISADLVLISSEAVHTKQVDANLLAEFVPCPVLLLP
ncbi:hypothetical protein OEZ85_007831 [Tetradesmus obliquus]|uniref:UspA domain-containing protein n=1 Tax=Tetradesmus obliquus TaxID=3088 RepID=A0ABY8TH41_TETOB|nr:hypothetical protein OEZ85_007831 [Tetradesmus obliquus]